jgi:predicted O-methyltransferase YrrM
MPDGPMTDKSGLILGLLGMLPEPIRGFYRTVVPERLRRGFRNFYPYEQDLVRAVRFWANPKARSRKKVELQRCRTPDDYFAFATKYFGHQQWKDEIIGFLNFAKEQNPIRVCELGLFLGGTNLMLTHALPNVQTIIGVDLHIRNKSQFHYFAKPSQKQIFVEGKTCDAATLQKVEQALGGDKLDLLLIDADHSYSGVKQDFLLYRHFVRDGGIIAFHDVVPDHLTKFKYDPASWTGARSGEVYLFWERIKPYYETREFVVDYEQDGCGIGALFYSSKVQIPDDL